MDFLVQILDSIRDLYSLMTPVFVIQHYEDAVVLRFGRYNRTVTAGLQFKIPFAEDFLTARNTITTLDVKPQSLTTRDGKSVVLASVIKYQIVDAKKFLLDVEEAKDALSDIARSRIKDLVINMDWEECKMLKDSEIKSKMGTEPEKWGIKLHLITITDLAIIRSFRLIQ